MRRWPLVGKVAESEVGCCSGWARHDECATAPSNSIVGILAGVMPGGGCGERHTALSWLTYGVSCSAERSDTSGAQSVYTVVDT
jgi:hypothetical protein